MTLDKKGLCPALLLYERKEPMKFTDRTRGFTIVEMLTVMGIIAILIGLLVPALNQVKDYAKQVQQRSQFHSIDVALELFKAEFGTYPESYDNIDPFIPANMKYAGATSYCGANKLAEALVGLDMLGFHPNSDFRSTGQNNVINKLGANVANVLVYHASTAVVNWETGDENIRARKGPYIDFENANVFRMNEVYTPANLALSGSFGADYADPQFGNSYPLTLCDVYAKRRTATNNKKTGAPILYFRARTNYNEQNCLRYLNTATGTITDGIQDDIYYLADNYTMLKLNSADDSTVIHPLAGTTPADACQIFEDKIVNKQVTTLRRPYRAGSYILLSAGKDGLYGTADDIYNFDKTAEQ
jgi:prepilin-type N-terminal cleavage/methylation domain-containing protein